MSPLNELERVRQEKLERLRQLGMEPYPRQVLRTHTNAAAIETYELREAENDETPVEAAVAGRLRAVREMGKLTFAHIEDGTGRLQLFLRQDELGDERMAVFSELFDLGDFIQARGTMFRTRSGEVTLRVSEFEMLAKALTPLPAAKEELVDGERVVHNAFADQEARYRQRYADLAVNPEVREVFQMRAAVTRALREFLDSRGFLEVETPVLQPIYGGAAANPFTTYHHQLKQELYLRISFELYLKRLLVGGFERVYEIGRDFRNEGVDRTHNPEFTQLEFYWAYADYQQVMDLTEEMIAYTADRVLGKTTVTYQGHKINLGQSWARMELSEGIHELAGIDIAEYPDAANLGAAMRAREIEVDPKATRGKLIDALIGTFLEPNFIQPTFLYNYPRDISPLAKNLPGNPQMVERFEGFMGGFELCNAFTELNDPLEQEKRFMEMGRAYAADDEERHPMDEDYLRAMRYGMPPNGGFGMGVDRLTMLFTDRPTIREVILFPHLRNREE